MEQQSPRDTHTIYRISANGLILSMEWYIVNIFDMFKLDAFGTNCCHYAHIPFGLSRPYLCNVNCRLVFSNLFN